MDYRQTMEDCLRYIEEHLSEPLSVEKLAGVVGYSPFHFSRIFREETGEPLYRYVQQKRLSRCHGEIRKGADPKAVYLKYGYETASGFLRAYRSRYGVSPLRKKSPRER